ncbi:kinase-like domain-containing protein [Crucibulum laeve]|uniref:Kinase-like domain-containing protein n=1 Tax=Crucibulum laeve TaxID=68775 RepID=A0A5C3LEN1_9AGAR|nr:kinase-like domain-containing protein [Crucibulum laeve]
MAGRPAMVMRWYENGNASEYLLRKNPFADRVSLVSENTMRWILDVARGLEYLHTLSPPIVHGDLKGNNVIITDEGRAALCDFGLSKVIEDMGRPSGYTLTQPDVGPLRWQAPEFLEHEDTPLLPSSDIWSFGCTAYELLTGNIPYHHRTRDWTVIKDVQNGIKPPGPSGIILPGLETRMIDILDDCWCFSPEERPTMTEVVEQIQQICNSSSF